MFRGEKEVGPVPRLALARDRNNQVFLLHCNARWQVLGVSGGHATVREAKRRAERFYTGIGKAWVATHYTRNQARRVLDRLAGPRKCSLCLRSPYDVEAMVEIKKRKFAVCDLCIRELTRLISSRG